MQQFLQLIVENLDLVLSVIFGFLCFLVTFFRTGSLKKSLNKLKEYEEMIKYQTAEKAQQVKPKGQEFSETIPDYILDPVTNVLEESPVPKNVQDLINSYIDVALDRALEKFLPKNVVDSNDVVEDYSATAQDLSMLGEAFDIAEEYRSKYCLSPDMSVADVYKFVAEQADKMKADLLKIDNVKKEVSQDVEKTSSQS